MTGAARLGCTLAMKEQIRSTSLALPGLSPGEPWWCGDCLADLPADSMLHGSHICGEPVTVERAFGGLSFEVINRDVPRELAPAVKTSAPEPAPDVQLPALPDLRAPLRRHAREQPAAPTPSRPITVAGPASPWAHAKRYPLSNGWFIDGATCKIGWSWGWKYSVWEPGGDRSGCAGYRGGAPTLALAVAVANGAVVCGRAEWGCRKVAIGYRRVTVRGTDGRVYWCQDHAP